MPTSTIEVLRRVNGLLRSAVTRFQPERTRCSAIQAGDLSTLRSEIRHAGDCLRALPAAAAKDPALELETRELRSNLESLKRALPGFHSRLLAEHARLAAARTHSVVASAWVQANKETL